MTKVIAEQAVAMGKAARVGVLVLGMHRSGTSALARVLSLLGCDLPANLMAPHPTNEAGHWESLPIAHLNDEILASAGSKWSDWLAFNAGWHNSPKAAAFKETALAVLEEEFGVSRLFVLKDPRICRLAPFWLDVLDAAGVRPAIIMPVRNPLEVAESLSKRDGIEPALGHLLWLRHVLEAEGATRGLPRFHSSYDGLLDGWPRLIPGTQVALSLSWPRLSPLVSEEIGAFLTERLRHHHQSPRSVSDNPLLSAWLRDTFAIFRRWSEDGETEADHAMLDRIRTELDAAAPAFARLISAGQQSAQKAKALDSSLKETQSKLTEAETAAAAKQQHAEKMEQELQAAFASKEREVAEAAERLATARAELSDLQAEAQSLRTELGDVRGELSHTQSALAQRSAEADETAAQLREAERRLAEELQAERARMAERFDEIASLSRTLHEKEAEVAAAQERSRVDREAAEHRLEEAERAGRLAEELDMERVRMAERFAEIASLTRMLREKEEEVSTALDRSRAEKDEVGRRLSERFGEIAVMTRLLGEKENVAKVSGEQAEWLREVSAVLMNGSGSETLKGRLAALLPAPIRLKKQKARLKRKGIFDADAYLAAHADVAEAGMDPLWHYINHGMGEGRQRG